MSEGMLLATSASHGNEASYAEACDNAEVSEAVQRPQGGRGDEEWCTR